MMSVIEALKKTPKGQLQYSRQINVERLKQELNHLSPPPLSRPHKETEFSKLNLSFGLDAADFEDTNLTTKTDDYNENYSPSQDRDTWSPRAGDEKVADWISTHKHVDISDEEEKRDLSKDDPQDPSDLILRPGRGNRFVQSPSSQAGTSPVSAQFGYTSCAIVDADKAWEWSAKLSLSERRVQFEDHDRALTFLMTQKWNEMNSKLDQQVQHRQTQIDRKKQEGLEETHKRLQRLKEDHEEHHKKISIKHKEIERQRELLEEEERKRREEHAERVRMLRILVKQVEENKDTFCRLHDQFSHKSQLTENVDKFRTSLERVTVGLTKKLEEVEQSPDLAGHMVSKFEEQRDRSSQAVEFLKKQMEEVEGRVKAEASKQQLQQQQQQQQKKQEEEQANKAKKETEAAAQNLAVQTLVQVLEEQKTRCARLAQVETDVTSFTSNPANKQKRFDLQKVVNTTINAISGVNGAHLLDKLKRLHLLLSGQMVEVSGKPSTPSVMMSGKYITVKDAPDALLFCQNLVAKMLVKKGEEEVSSKHESAFAIGAVVVAMWVEFPVVGEIFLSRLQASCPYVLPVYAGRKDGQSSQDYYKSLGYKVSEDGTVEEQDKFLRRMSGLMRLYCACMVANPPPSTATHPHPHGVEHAWIWLARTMNLDPQPDVTAAMIYDVLSVMGHALFREYRVQFAKLLYLLYKEYLPKLESVSVTSATVGRLRGFLEQAIQTRQITPPDGILQPNFWSTS